MSWTGRAHLRDLGGRAFGVLRSPLYGSGYALLVNAAGTAAIGFVYWAAAAHLYSAQTLGRNSALVSALLLVSNFAQLNLHSTLPRFLPQAGRSAPRLVTYSYGASALAALVIGVAVVTVLPKVNSNWQFVGESALLAVLFAAGTILWGLFNLEDATLVGLHRSVVIPVENTVYGMAKLVMLLGLAAVLPATGIFVSWVIPLVVVIPVVNWLIFRRYLADEEHPAVATALRAREVLRFASIDYVGAAIGQGAWNLLPLLVLSALGAAANGNFYIAFTLASGLTMVTANFSYSMLAEGAKAPHRLPELTRGVLLRCTIVTVPAAGLMAVAAGPILSIYGPGYAAHASELLGLLALTAIPTGLVTIAFSLDRLAARVGRATLTQGIRAALILGGSWLLMRHLGINGVGLACLVGSLVVALARLPTIVDVARRPGARGTSARPGGGAGSGMLRRLGSLKLPPTRARTSEPDGRAQAPEPSSMTQPPESSAAGGGTLPGVARGGIAARHAPVARDARRLRPAAIGYILIAALALIVFVRHVHGFAWGSAWGIVYLIILGMLLLAGAVGLARGLSRATGRHASTSRVTGSSLAADLRARKSAGAILLESPRIIVAAAARAPLADGSVDPRALVTLAMLAAIHPLDILGFGAGNGAGTEVPLRTADITWAVPPGDHCPASLGTLRAILIAQRPPYLPSSIQTVTVPPGRIVLRITYPAPSPLGPLGQEPDGRSGGPK